MSREKQTFGAESITELPCWQGAKQCLCEIECEDCIESHLLAAGWRQQEWISVEDRLPEECTHVIVHDEDGTVGEAFHSSGDYFEWVANEKMAFPTHWMPLPEPPKGE